MKAAILKAFGSPLVVETMPDPVLGTGEVIVDVVACPMPMKSSAGCGNI
jgi:alcohol dehydrogenase